MLAMMTASILLGMVIVIILGLFLGNDSLPEEDTEEAENEEVFKPVILPSKDLFEMGGKRRRKSRRT